MWPWLLTISRGMTGTLWWTNITDSIGSWSRSAMVVKPCNWTLTEFVLLTLCHSFKCRCLRFQKPLVWPSSRKAISRISLTDPKIKITKGPFQINTIICQRWCQLVVAKRLKRGMPNRQAHSILLKSWCRIAGFHMTSLNSKLQNYWSCWDFTLMMYKSS